MNITIRPATDNDYDALITVNNAVFPEYPETADDWREYDQRRDPKYFWHRNVAELDGQIVGYNYIGHVASMFHPHKFWVNVQVHPEYQGQGIGKLLYTNLLQELEPLQPIAIRTSFREDLPRSMRFAEDRGFKEDMRVWESRLAVDSFDPTPFLPEAAKAEASGIEIKTLRELQADPDHARKIYELIIELDRDVPSPEPYTPPAFEYFQKNLLGDSNLLPDAFFIALDNGEYVGHSALWNSKADNDLYTGLTGVKRSHRRRGIAIALKLRGIDYAKAQNKPTIKTWNESNNRPMLSINERMGYVRQPAWVNMANQLKTEE